MPKVIVDPDEVRRFASALSEMAEHLQSKKSHVKGHFDDLKGVWQDEKYTQFSRVFEEAVAHMDRFLRYADLYAQYLKKKAQKADVFLRTRY
jgi:uncharacterized protein YukE